MRCIRKSGNNDGLPAGTAMFSPRLGCYFNCAKSRGANVETYMSAMRDGLKGKADEYVAATYANFDFKYLNAQGFSLNPTEGTAWFCGEDPAVRLFDQADLSVVLAPEWGPTMRDAFIVENNNYWGTKTSFVQPALWRVGGYKAKWVVALSCNLFGDPDGASGGEGHPRNPAYATKQNLAKALSQGAHVVLGFASRVTSDPQAPPKNADKLKAFGTTLAPDAEGKQKEISKAWLDSMEYKDAQGSGWYQYVDPRVTMKWWRQIPVAFGGNIKYKIGETETTNYQEKLPVGGAQLIGPGFRIEPNDANSAVLLDYREYGPPRPPQN